MNNLWELAVEEANKADGEGRSGEENSVFFVGGKNSGKTSIVLRFLDRNEASKSTVALEYTYARRAKGHNMAKDIGHIWELGGGTWLSKLMDIPQNPDTILNTALFVVLDLSNPSEMWFTLETLLEEARKRIENVIADMKHDYPDIRETLKRRSWERLGDVQEDKSMIDPFPIPLVIVGSKYDLFQDFDSEKRKVICKTLRFVAHTNGASLQCCSILSNDISLETSFKDISNDLSHDRIRQEWNKIFQTVEFTKVMQQEYSKPLVIPAGLDSLAAIGNVPLSDSDIGRVNARKPIDLWKHCFTSFFPQTNTENPSQVEDPAKNTKYAEQAVDNLRAQKDEELERYKRMSDRRAQKKAQGAYGDA